jgi:hypothetical protein
MHLKYLIILFLMAGKCWASLDIPGTAGCTSFLTAMQTATATPGSLITLSQTQNELVTIGAINTSLTLDLQGHPVTNTGAGGIFRIVNTMAGALTIKSTGPPAQIISYCTTAGSNWINITGLAAGSPYFYFRNLSFDSGVSFLASSDYMILADLNFANTNSFIVDSCQFSNSGGVSNLGYILLGGTSASADSGVVKGSLFKNTYVGVRTKKNNCIDLYNNTFSNNTYALGSAALTILVENTLFVNNANDVSLVSPVSFLYCASTKFVAGWGTGSVFRTAAQMFCDPNNYWLALNPSVMNGGVSINGITNTLLGLNGVKLGGSGVIEMGCMGYSTALCPGRGSGSGK